MVPVLVNLLDTGPPIVVVFDDLHLVDNPAVYDGLTLLLERLPPQVTLAVGTRVDPPLRPIRARRHTTSTGRWSWPAGRSAHSTPGTCTPSPPTSG
jgi:hypothetical protein